MTIPFWAFAMVASAATGGFFIALPAVQYPRCISGRNWLSRRKFSVAMTLRKVRQTDSLPALHSSVSR